MYGMKVEMWQAFSEKLANDLNYVYIKLHEISSPILTGTNIEAKVANEGQFEKLFVTFFWIQVEHLL